MINIVLNKIGVYYDREHSLLVKYDRLISLLTQVMRVSDVP